MMDEKTRALLGDREAAKRLTEQGVLVPCCGKAPQLNCFIGLGAWAVECSANGHIHNTGLCNSEFEARLAWNTRAPLLTPAQMEVLGKMEDSHDE